jgi:cell division cycle 14
MTANLSVEIIPNKLYWVSDKTPPRNQANSYYFCIDNELVYQPFCSDFGPLNIGMTYKFCIELEKLIKNQAYSAFKIYHYTSLVPQKRVNAAYLMGAFQILVLKKSAQQAWNPFTSLPNFLDFRDAGYGGCTYKCTVLHCLKGLEKAIQLGWFNYATFNIQEYEFYEKVENGDWNWIIPNKMLAFASPSPSASDDDGFKVWTPEDYSVLFKNLGVTTVIRLNNKTYDSDRFIQKGIKHHDLYFLDGSVPSESIIKEFLRVAESEKGALAIHCKAGLGRTGTLIGIYAMKHYDFPAADFIGWIRLCRPGSVLGPQQQFLVEIEPECKKWGNEFRGSNPDHGTIYNREETKTSSSKKIENRLEMSPEEHYVSMHGDHGQAERLVNAKKSNQSSPNTPVITSKSPPASRNHSQNPYSPFKSKAQTNNIFVKSAVRNITPGSGRPSYSRKSPLLK